jgi:hypothetical protein
LARFSQRFRLEDHLNPLLAVCLRIAERIKTLFLPRAIIPSSLHPID